ncbi:MAG: bacteriohemerythrin [Bdellovibrionota bacterium]
MADFFKWDASQLSVKVKSMDDEHIALIKKMNSLHEAYARKAGREELAKLLHDFAAYTVKHFADEEAYMTGLQFEGLATHKIIHAQLLEQVNKHVADFEKNGTLTDAFFSFLTVWLTSHIRGIDTKYSASKAKAA